MKRLMFLLVLAGFAVVAFAGGHRYSGSFNLEEVIDSTDTAANGWVRYVGYQGLEAQVYNYRAPVVSGITVVGVAHETYHGFGLADSCWIWLLTDRTGQTKVLDSVVQAGLPCTLEVLIDSTKDIFYNDAYLKYEIRDSTTDTVFTPHFPIKYDFKVVAE